MIQLWNRRAADEFAAALDGRELSDAAAERVGPLVAVAQSLRATPQPQLRPGFAAGLRTRLLAEAEHELVGGELAADTARPRPEVSAETIRQRRRRRGLSIATGVAVLSVTSVGAGFASERSMPGEALYPLKRSIERVHVATTSDPADRGHILLDQANTRLGEVEALWERHHNDPAAGVLMQNTLGTFSDEVRDATDSFVTAYRDDSDHGGIAELREFNQKSLIKLDELNTQLSADGLPAEVTNEVILAAGDLAESDSTALATCLDCSELKPLEDNDAAVLDEPLTDPETGEAIPDASSPIVGAIVPSDLYPFVDPEDPTGGGQPNDTRAPADPDPTTAGPTEEIPPPSDPVDTPVTTDDPAPGTTPEPTSEPPTSDQPTTDPTDPTQEEPTGSSGPVPTGPDPSTASASDPSETTTPTSTAAASDAPVTTDPVAASESGGAASGQLP